MPVAIETTAFYFLLSWDTPTFPNGILTGYVLYMGDTLLYSGNENQFNVTGLDVSECDIEMLWDTGFYILIYISIKSVLFFLN